MKETQPWQEYEHDEFYAENNLIRSLQAQGFSGEQLEQQIAKRTRF